MWRVCRHNADFLATQQVFVMLCVTWRHDRALCWIGRRNKARRVGQAVIAHVDCSSTACWLVDYCSWWWRGWFWLGRWIQQRMIKNSKRRILQNPPKRDSDKKLMNLQVHSHIHVHVRSSIHVHCTQRYLNIILVEYVGILFIFIEPKILHA